MFDAEKLAALIDEFCSLDRSRDADRMRQILEQAIPEVDRGAAPKKWAALQSRLGDLRSEVDPLGALEAYRKSLEVWTLEDPDPWVHCHREAGMLLFGMQPLGPDEVEEAIEHLKAAVPAEPFLASPLALLYQLRPVGDPLENWRNRLKYLEMTRDQISVQDEPEKWAKAENDLAVADAEKPGGDFFDGVARRRERLEAILEALGDSRGPAYIETCMNLSEVYLSGDAEDQKGDHLRAEDDARRALAAAESLTDVVIQARARLAVGRALVVGRHRGRTEDLREALGYFDDAIATFRHSNRPALEANALFFRTNAQGQLALLGETDLAGPMADQAEAALGLLDPVMDHDQRRTNLQASGEAQLDADRPDRAVEFFERAVAEARLALARATTPEGRMERIWEFGDSSALLSYCYLKQGREEDSLRALEDGKGRYWNAAEAEGDLSQWIPPGGALLFANFSHDPGAVIAVTGAGRKVIWLPGFGKSRLMELQRGGLDSGEVGGWLRDYSYQTSKPKAWVSAINTIGSTLYDEVWAPVIAELPRLGVQDGAELVWFPQGGSGVFPIHAAWCFEAGVQRWLVDRYAIRYATSVKALAAKASSGGQDGPDVLVINPRGDLPFAELEGAWVIPHFKSTNTRVFRRSEATKEAVLGALIGAKRIHLATHALFDLNDPLASSVLLAGQEMLRLDEWRPHLAGQAPDLVVLSACETGMARVTVTPEEFLGFPATLLHAGVGSVIASLWLVDDEAGAHFMGRFYDELDAPETSPAEALRRAQTWLRTATIRDLKKRLRQLRDDPEPVGEIALNSIDRLDDADLDSCPFADPYFWAAFTVVGH